MPMNPRLLRPTSSSLDPDAAVYLNAVAQEDGEQLEPAVRKAINDFVRGCKQDGIWTAIKASCILMGARTLSGALTPLVGAAPTNNGPFVSGDYDRETGLLGNGNGKLLDSNRASNADPQDSVHLSAYVSVIETDTNTRGLIGVTTGVANHIISAFVTATFRNNSRCRSSVLLNHTNLAGTGLRGISRGSASSYIHRSNGASSTHSVTSTGASATNNTVFQRAGSASNTTSNARLAFYSIGEDIDLALLDTRVTSLYNAIGAAI